MTAQYRFLDEVNIDKQDTLRTYSSKWWFYGTKAELEAWLPNTGDDANFSDLDSSNPLLGNQWAPTGYKIKSSRATALDRFEWSVDITAVDSTSFGANFTYPRNKDNLLSKDELEITKGSFTITEEHAGFKWNPQISDYEDLKLTSTWTEANDCPFTTRPDKQQVNQNIPVAIIQNIVYLSGKPENNLSAFLSFKGVQTLKGVSGRVIESRMVQVNDSKGDVFTQWTKSIMVAPDGFSWNSNWKGID